MFGGYIIYSGRRAESKISTRTLNTGKREAETKSICGVVLWRSLWRQLHYCNSDSYWLRACSYTKPGDPVIYGCLMCGCARCYCLQERSRDKEHYNTLELQNKLGTLVRFYLVGWFLFKMKHTYTHAHTHFFCLAIFLCNFNRIIPNKNAFKRSCFDI